MELLDIKEPEEIKHRIAIGIDFGTTNSLVGYLEDDTVKIISSPKLIPSVVSFNGLEITIGSSNVGLSIRSIKRILGKSYSEIMGLSGIPSEIKENLIQTSRGGEIQIGERSYTPVEIVSFILRKLKDDASKYLNQEVTLCCITVPAYFNDLARTCVKQAATLAGLEVLRLLNEPTAAALCYSLDKKAQGMFLVYDLGGGTFDVSLLNIYEGIVQVVKTDGITNLGGDDIDHAIKDFIRENSEVEVSLQEASEIKKAANEGRAIFEGFRTEDFNALLKPIVNKTIRTTHKILQEVEDLKGIILVGGSTRLKLVKDSLKVFNAPLLDDLDPDEAVAIGASIHADHLVNRSNYVLIDVLPLSLGVEMYGGFIERIIERNSPLPAFGSSEFVTYQDNQTGMQFHIVQGEREFAKDCISLGYFELKCLPPLPAGHVKVTLSFRVDCDGILYAEATENVTGKACELLIKQKQFDRQGLKDLLEESFKHISEDKERRAREETALKASMLHKLFE